MSALSPVIESLATSKAPEDVKRLHNVWAASKMLIEIHRSQTVARKACIFPNLSKQWASTLEKCVTDNYLFGDKLADKVKVVKAMGKVGEEMKSSIPKKNFSAQSSLNFRSSSSHQQAVTQTNYKNHLSKKPSTFKEQPKQPAYPKSSQYRQIRHRNQAC